MFLFPVDGILEVVLSYGQMISLFLVFVIFEGMIAAKSETAKPGLVFIYESVANYIAGGVYFSGIPAGGLCRRYVPRYQLFRLYADSCCDVLDCVFRCQKDKRKKYCEGHKI